MALLRVGGFGGGVVLEGGADQRRITELLQADALDIATRGALVAAADATDYVTLEDRAVSPLPVTGVFGAFGLYVNGVSQVAVVTRGTGENGSGGLADSYLLHRALRVGSPAVNGTPVTFRVSRSPTDGSGTPVTPLAEGIIVTGLPWPGKYQFRRFSGGSVTESALYLVNLGAREGFAPRRAPGLYLQGIGDGSGIGGSVPVGQLDALGTGLFSPDLTTAGSEAKQLYFRGIIGYNNHVFGWGFDDADATDGDGPNRVMFSNLGDPTKWGNDNVAAAGTDRAFTDSDAIVLGDAGERIRAALVWNGRLFFGTNRGLHFIAGYGRDSFVTNGATPVMQAENVLGPWCLLEGPDRAMYGVGDNGLWRFSGQGVPTPLGEKLRDFGWFSTGWWDLIWVDPDQPIGAYPGTTNQDLVWMAADFEAKQVLVGIPWCDASAGYGPGQDTVIIKYHVRTGGFTRQVFAGVQYTAAAYLRREANADIGRFLATPTSGEVTLQRYAYRSDALTPPAMPSPLPAVTFGDYAPFGPEGHGVVPRMYLTLAWDAGALPLTFTCTQAVDGVTVNSFGLTVGPTAPGAPVAGDLWVDTSGSSTAIGNGTAATSIAAAGGYLAYVRNADTWQLIPGLGAEGIRVTIPLPLTRRQGTRLTFAVACTAAAGRFSFEGLGLETGAGEQTA